MVYTTKAQRQALKRIYERLQRLQFNLAPSKPSQSYRQFRQTVRGYIGGDCIMVPFAGMWLGIERDGHTYS